MRILVAPQEFKGTLTAAEAARAMADALAHALPGAILDVAPLSDGGPGFVEALHAALGGERRESIVEGPLGAPVRAGWVWLEGLGTAVLEMAAASGLTLLPERLRDPLAASTYGTGQLLAEALQGGGTRILLGLGGSATTDGGAGALTALGARFLDERGVPLPRGGAALARLARIDVRPLHPMLGDTDLILATDVVNPLLGARGAAAVYGPQKGASAQQVQRLEQGLGRLAEVVHAQFGIRVEDHAGMGAAGGLSYGLAALAGGQVQSGFTLVAEILGLEERVARADWVLTGEGRLDSQTAEGKGPGRLGELARRLGKRVALFAGSIDESYFATAAAPFDVALSLAHHGTDARARPYEVLSQAVRDWAKAHG